MYILLVSVPPAMVTTLLFRDRAALDAAVARLWEGEGQITVTDDAGNVLTVRSGAVNGTVAQTQDSAVEVQAAMGMLQVRAQQKLQRDAGLGLMGGGRPGLGLLS